MEYLVSGALVVPEQFIVDLAALPAGSREQLVEALADGKAAMPRHLKDSFFRTGGVFCRGDYLQVDTFTAGWYPSVEGLRNIGIEGHRRGAGPLVCFCWRGQGLGSVGRGRMGMGSVCRPCVCPLLTAL